MSNTGFSSSSGIGGGDPHADYNPTSTDLRNQPAGDAGHYGGGVGDRTEGAGNFGGEDKGVSSGDQYGSSGGYLPGDASANTVKKVKTE